MSGGGTLAGAYNSWNAEAGQLGLVIGKISSIKGQWHSCTPPDDKQLTSNGLEHRTFLGGQDISWNTQELG